jgi:hypothetical protein
MLEKLKFIPDANSSFDQIQSQLGEFKIRLHEMQ